MNLATLASLSLLAAGQALATPVYYSFEGTATYSTDAGVNIGQALHYTFMVDVDQPGYYIEQGVSQNPWGDYVDGSGGGVDYFQAEYLGGDAIADLPNSGPSAGISYHVGVNEYNYYGNNLAELVGSNGDPTGLDEIVIYHPSLNLSQWVPSTTGFTFQDVTYDEGYGNIYIVGEGTLVSVSAQNPLQAVPEPTSLALLGFGLIGLSLAARKKLRT